MHRVCRAYSQTPDQVRGWFYEDFLEALDFLGEIPLVDEAFYRGFCGKSGDAPIQPGPALSDPEDRKKLVEDLKRRKEMMQGG